MRYRLEMLAWAAAHRRAARGWLAMTREFRGASNLYHSEAQAEIGWARSALRNAHNAQTARIP